MQFMCWCTGNAYPLIIYLFGIVALPIFSTLKTIFQNYLFIIFLAVLGLCCSTGFSLVVTNGGYSLVTVHRLLIAVASLVKHRLQGSQASVVVAHGLCSFGSWALEHRLRFNSFGARAQSLCGMQGVLGPGAQPLSLALASDPLPLSHQGSP